MPALPCIIVFKRVELCNNLCECIVHVQLDSTKNTLLNVAVRLLQPQEIAGRGGRMVEPRTLSLEV